MVPGLDSVPTVWSGQVFHQAILRRAQLEVGMPMRLLGEVLARFFELVGDVHALGLQLAPLIGGDLRGFALLLRDAGGSGSDHRLRHPGGDERLQVTRGRLAAGNARCQLSP